MRLTEQPRGAGSHHAVLGRVEDGLWQRDGVSHHGAVQAVLRHDATATPALLALSPLRPPVLEPNLEEISSLSKPGVLRKISKHLKPGLEKLQNCSKTGKLNKKRWKPEDRLLRAQIFVFCPINNNQ